VPLRNACWASLAAEDKAMLRIPRKYGHFIFGVIQAALTTAIAAGVASISFFGTLAFVENWLSSWLIAWMTTIPIVLLAAPGIQRVVLALTIERGSRSEEV
jgi:hypothetical protein